MRASRFILIFIVSMIVKCGIPDAPPDPVNPYDPNNPDYEPAGVTIVSGPSDGETTHSSDVTFSWTGNETAGDFSYRLDNNSWGNWSPDTSVTYEYLDEKTYLFEIIARAGNQDHTIGDTTSLEFTVDAVTGPALMIYPRYQTVSVGNTTTLEIKAEEVENVMGAEIEISFDASIIQIDSVYTGNFFGQNGSNTIFFQEADNSTGNINIVSVSAGGAEATVTGSGTLVHVNVKGISSGTTELTFSQSCVYRDENNEDIEIMTKTGGILDVE